MRNFDRYGVVGGMLKSIWDIIATNICIIFKLKTFRWGLFEANEEALIKMRDFAQNGQVCFQAIY